MAVGCDNKANERRGSRFEIAACDEVCVDNGVEQMVVYGVVYVGILIIITPNGLDKRECRD